MQDSAPEGRVRRPVPEAWGDPRYVVNTIRASGIGIALFCGALLIPRAAGIQEWSVLTNFLATPLFAVPLIVALFRSGRIGVVGALVVTFGMTVAHFEATIAAMCTYKMGPSDICLFVDAAECRARFERAKAAHEPIGRASVHKAGPVAGALGAAFSFAFIATLAPGLRDRRRLTLYVIGTLALAALGWLGFFMNDLPQYSENDQLQWVMKLYLPWQLAFAFAIVMAFKDHQAVRYMRAPG